MNEILPKLLLISDAPLTSSGRGNSEALLRLFDNYPKQRLHFAQTRGELPALERRMLCAGYHDWSVPWDRLLHTRLSKFANILKATHHRFFSKMAESAARELAPDAIVTLVHGNGWVLARRLAATLRVPLHLIVHDGPSHFHLEYPLIGSWLRREFTQACQQAYSRWSICTALDQHITQLTCVPGHVLPPMRAKEDQRLKSDTLFSDSSDGVYFGGLSSVSITAMMNNLSNILRHFDATLHVFGGVAPHVVTSPEWKNRKFRYHGPFDDRSAFLDHCRKNYGFMYLPFSFLDQSTRLSFPSKLIDYTLVGLPILVQAPRSSPIGVWCAENPNAALFVGEPGVDSLMPTVHDIVKRGRLRIHLANGAFNAGERDFAFEANFDRFVNVISTSSIDSRAIHS